MSYKLFPIGTIPYILGGNPASGYKVYTYVTGTTTPKSTYTDSTGGTANTNPVVFDANGLKQIWLNTDSNYKLVVKSSDDGTTYLTLDNVEGLSSSLTGSPPLSGILDANGNEILGFSGVASALNYVNFTNAATGSGAIIKGVGDDVSVDLRLECQGTGRVKAIAPLEVTTSLYHTGSITPTQITSNQNDYAPTGFSSVYGVYLSSDAARDITGLAGGTSGRCVYLYNSGSFNITLKASSGSSSAANQFNFYGDITLGPKQGIRILHNGTNWLTDALGGAAAIQADVEAVTTNSVSLTPGNAKYHPGVAKAWAHFNGTGTPAYVAAYNCSSITDNGVGDWSINFTTSFSSANYVAISTGISTGAADGTSIVSIRSSGYATGSVRVCSEANGDNSVANVMTDISQITVACFGDF